MKKILWFTTSTNNTQPVIDSLRYLNCCELRVEQYDEKWNTTCAQLIQSNPQAKAMLQSGQYAQLGIPRERVAMDAEMVSRAEDIKPDLILYTSAWEGLFVPKDETLAKLNTIAPTVHILYDGADNPWWTGDESHGNILRYERNKCFALTVTIDGAQEWPGNPDWTETMGIRGLSLLTPVDPRYFAGPTVPFSERPYPIAYAGNYGGYIRSFLVQRLQQDVKGFAVKPRDDNAGSYVHYAQFLKYCRVVVNVPFSGSNSAKHVKGRVVEAGWGGAALLEWKNDATAAWFTPRHDYEEYSTVEECIDMAHFLAARPKRCEDMAAALSEKVRSEHSPEKFWRQVFDAVKVDAEFKDAAD